jgi:4-amino-4-deoxy-L-arabinose transferase-like glycosyltransferase
MVISPQPVSRTTRIACFIVAILSVASLAYPPPPVLTLLGDSEQYRQAGEALLSGDIFRPFNEQVRTSHIAVSLRPPLFPLLLGITTHLPLLHPDTALITAHIVLGCLLLVAATVALWGSVNPLLTTLATGFALYSVKQAAWGIMSEWLAMCLLFLAALLYLAWISRASPWLALAVALCLSLAILTRAALLPWFALPLIMILQAPRGTHRVTALAISAGLLPLFLWGAVNLHRTGTFSVLPYEGLNLFATARSLGTIPPAPNDSDPDRRLITDINERGITAPDTAFTPTGVHRWEGEFYGAFHINFNVTTDTLRYLTMPHAGRPYSLATRGLRAHTDRYRRFLWGGVIALTCDYLPLIVLCAIATVWLAQRTPQTARWALGVITLCVISLTYLIVIFSPMLWLHRYIIPAQPILVFCLAVSATRLVGTLLQRRLTTEL